jgi:putative FmdB family regulatory protein
MPIYEFRCPQCGEEFEELVLRMGSESQVRCPECGAQGPEKKISRFASRASSGGVSQAACTTSF